MKKLPLLLIAESALRSIKQEALRFPSVETGGILIGKDLGQQDGVRKVLLAAATGPGPGSYHQAAEFSPNTAYQQEILDWFLARPDTKYLGSWHKHPARLVRPSSGDLRQAKEILADPDYGVTELIVPIVTVSQGKVSVIPYYLTRGMTHFAELDWELVPDDALVVREFWGPKWFETEAGQTRIWRDRHSLLTNGASEVKGYVIDGEFCYYVTMETPVRCPGGDLCQELVFLCGRNYPYSPPLVYLLNEERQHPTNLSALRYWTPKRLLGDLMAELNSGNSAGVLIQIEDNCEEGDSHANDHA